MTTVTITDVGSEEVTIPVTDTSEIIVQTLSSDYSTVGYIANHSAATNLDADDHPQYLNITRGDARYIATSHSSDTTIHFTQANIAGLANTQITGYTNLTPTNVSALTDGVNTTLHIHNADRARAVHTGTQALTTVVNPNVINAPLTYLDLKEYIDSSVSAGITGTPGITVSSVGVITIAAVNYLIRAGTGGTGTLYSGYIAGDSSLTIADGVTNYLYLDYNSGTPAWALTADSTTVNMSDKILAAAISRSGTVAWVIELNDDSVDANAKLRKKTFYLDGTQKSTGGVPSTPGTLQIAVTAGTYWNGLSSLPAHLALAGGGIFKYYYYNGSAWIENASAVAISDTQYNNVASGLVALTAAYYCNHWIYAVFGNSISEYAVVYGQAEYANIGDAQAEDPPTTVPNHLNSAGYLIGAATVLKSAGVIADVRTVSSSTSGAAATTHNTLSGLNVGAYQHLNVLEYNQTAGIGWKDLLGTFVVDPSGGTAPTKTPFRGTIEAFEYASNDEAEYSFHIPHDWVVGTDLYIHVHWGHNAASISGNMVWTLEVTYAPRTLTVPYGVYVAPITATINSNTITAATMNITNYPQYCHCVEEIQLSDPAPSASQLDTDDIAVDGLVLVHVTCTTPPTLGGGAKPYLFYIDVHYQAQGLHTPNKDPDFYTPTYV